jgi:murein DD-endopeptidase MepM/ murein hydrolase activator NlpD
VLKNLTVGGSLDRLRSWFPEREFFMRSHGQVRFIKVSSKLQMRIAGAICGAILVWAASMGAVAIYQVQSSFDRASLLTREARVASVENQVDAYRGDIAKETATLQRRQELLESLVSALPEDMVVEEASVAIGDSSPEAQKLIGKVSHTIPEAAGLARLEARQFAFVDRLTSYADRRATRAEHAIRTLGLDPRAMLAANVDAMGGPLERFSSNADGTLDPRFERLGLSLARMGAFERGLEGIPQVMPADFKSISSGFGVRHDPFTGAAAMHAGLDFGAPLGSPINAAAAGRVSFVGVKSGYGNVVEISHGSGMITRYAHMSAFSTRVGQQVEAGDRIGAIGSTGRSTGPHLHFEVRINGRAVNPRPFLETAPHVLEEARAASTGSTPAPRAVARR